METGLDVEQVGFIDHPALGFTGASPDGLVGADGLVEIKCPQPATHIKTLTGAAIDRKYALQMQWQMACTEREWCDFVSFCPSLPLEMQLFRQRVDRDVEQVEEIAAAIANFLNEVAALEADLTRKYASAA